jgi:hypothetical protein
VILTDAGPLVALVHAGDRNHHRCVAVTKALQGPMATVWPALTEAMYLLRFSWPAQRALWSMLEEGWLRLLPLDESDAPRIGELMRKYRDLPMDLADAALVRVAEREKLRRVFTLDRRDFSLYRPLRLGRFILVP